MVLTLIIVWLALQLPLGMLIGRHFKLAWEAPELETQRGRPTERFVLSALEQTGRPTTAPMVA